MRGSFSAAPRSPQPAHRSLTPLPPQMHPMYRAQSPVGVSRSPAPMGHSPGGRSPAHSPAPGQRVYSWQPPAVGALHGRGCSPSPSNRSFPTQLVSSGGGSLVVAPAVAASPQSFGRCPSSGSATGPIVALPAASVAGSSSHRSPSFDGAVSTPQRQPMQRQMPRSQSGQAVLPAPLPMQRVISHDEARNQFIAGSPARGPAVAPGPVPMPVPSAMSQPRVQGARSFTIGQGVSPAVSFQPQSSSFQHTPPARESYGNAVASSAFPAPPLPLPDRSFEAVALEGKQDEYSEPSDDLDKLLAYLEALTRDALLFNEVTYIVNDFTYWGIPMKHHGFVLQAMDPRNGSPEFLTLDFTRRGILWDTFDEYPDCPEGTVYTSRHNINTNPKQIRDYCKESQPFSWPNNDCAAWSRGMLKVMRVKESAADDAVSGRLPNPMKPSKGSNPLHLITCGGSRANRGGIGHCFS